MEVGAEVPVEKFHTVLKGGPLRRLAHQLVVLVGADKQAGSERVKAQFLGLPGGFEKAHLIAFAAAVFDILGNRPHEGPQAVIVPFNEF